MSNSYQMVPLRDVLQQRSEFIEIDDFKTYKRCRVQLHAQGIIERDIVQGIDIKTKKQQVCHAGEFLVAEIDAKVGGFGIVPDNLDGAIVSNHYFLFSVDETVLSRRFLEFFVRTPAFMEQVRAQGTTNYAAIRPGDVLGYKVPLPSLQEQCHVVARIEELAARIEEARGLKKRAIDNTSRIFEAAMRWLFNFEAAKRTVGNFASVLGGFAFPSGQYTDNGSHQIIRIGNIRDGYLDLSRAPVRWDLKNDSRIAKYRLVEGDILISMTGTRNKRDYGYIAIVPQRQNLLLNQRVGKFIFHATINRGYLAYFLRSPFFRDHLFPNATGTANQANIGNKHIENVPFDPPPSLEEQQSIVAYLDDLQIKVNSLKQLQSETSAELDALLPSILDKAFKGEL